MWLRHPNCCITEDSCRKVTNSSACSVYSAWGRETLLPILRKPFGVEQVLQVLRQRLLPL